MPLALNNFTSGYNVAKNITDDIIFSNLCGFTESELQKPLKFYF